MREDRTPVTAYCRPVRHLLPLLGIIAPVGWYMGDEKGDGLEILFFLLMPSSEACVGREVVRRGSVLPGSGDAGGRGRMVIHCRD